MKKLKGQAKGTRSKAKGTRLKKLKGKLKRQAKGQDEKS